VWPRDERNELENVTLSIRRVARRLNAQLVVRALVGPVWGIVAGIALWRFTVQRWMPAAAAVLALAGAAVVWSLVRHRLVTQRQAAVIADRRANAGGLLLTSLETGVGGWKAPLDTMVAGFTPPPFDVARPAAVIALALACLGVVVWIPLPNPVTPRINAAAEGRVEELVQQLAAVAKEEPVEIEMQKEVERLREELKEGTFDAADWESADSLGHELEHKAEEADNELLKAEEATANLERTMTEGRTLERLDREREELEQALMQLSDGKAENAEQAFQQAFDTAPTPPSASDLAAADPKPHADPQSTSSPQTASSASSASSAHPTASSSPTSETKSTPHEGGQKQASGEGNGHLDPTKKQLEELKRALERRRSELGRSFGQGQSGAQRSASSRRSQKSRHGEKNEAGNEESSSGGEEATGEGTATHTERVASGPHASHLMAGAPEHGPAADTDLVFAGAAEMDPARLKLRALPEGLGGEGTELLGLVAGNPTQSRAHRETAGSGAAVAGEQAPANREESILPRNKALIQRYFDSPREKTQ
jgi:hypothetical protein